MSLKARLWQLARTNGATSRLLALRTLSRASHLRSIGWFDTFKSSMSIDASGAPIPWYTYPAIRFLSERVKPTMSVFEYGSGNSTLWWSSRVGRITSCEHDTVWYGKMRGLLPASVTYLQADEAGGAYARQISQQNAAFDIVVVDGRDRVQCARAATSAMSPEGVIVWDNSDRPDYSEGYDFLSALGFRRLDFWGMGPINTYEWSTSIFYRSGNCLHL